MSISIQEVSGSVACDICVTFAAPEIEKKNKAAAGLCAWVINIVMYHDILVTVEPKRAALRAVVEQQRLAMRRLEEINARVAELRDRLLALSALYEVRACARVGFRLVSSLRVGGG